MGMDGLWSQGHGFSPWFKGPKWDPQWQLKEGPCPLKGRRFSHFWPAVRYSENQSPNWIPGGNQAVWGTSMTSHYSDNPSPLLSFFKVASLFHLSNIEHIWTIRGKQIQTVWKHNAIVLGLCFLFLQDFLYLLEKKKEAGTKRKLSSWTAKMGILSSGITQWILLRQPSPPACSMTLGSAVRTSLPRCIWKCVVRGLFPKW